MSIACHDHLLIVCVTFFVQLDQTVCPSVRLIRPDRIGLTSSLSSHATNVIFFFRPLIWVGPDYFLLGCVTLNSCLKQSVCPMDQTRLPIAFLALKRPDWILPSAFCLKPLDFAFCLLPATLWAQRRFREARSLGKKHLSVHLSVHDLSVRPSAQLGWTGFDRSYFFHLLHFYSYQLCYVLLHFDSCFKLGSRFF